MTYCTNEFEILLSPLVALKSTRSTFKHFLKIVINIFPNFWECSSWLQKFFLKPLSVDFRFKYVSWSLHLPILAPNMFPETLKRFVASNMFPEASKCPFWLQILFLMPSSVHFGFKHFFWILQVCISAPNIFPESMEYDYFGFKNVFWSFYVSILAPNIFP